MSDHIRILHLEKGIDRGLHDTVRIRGTFALGQHVLDTDALEDGTHSTTGDNTGTGSSRFQEDASTAILASLLVGDGTFEHGNLDEVFLGIVDTLLDGSLNFLGFAKSISHNAVFVSNNYDSRETESSTALGNLGYTINCDKTIFEFDLAGFYSFYVYFCHNLLEF